MSTKSLLDELLDHAIRACGIPPLLRGCDFIRLAGRIMAENYGYTAHLGDVVYPRVASLCFTTTGRVERAVAHAIEISWSLNGERSLKNHFVNGIPSDSEFFRYLIQYISSLEELRKSAEKKLT